jgi:Protein of unknown function (DUF3987)
LQGVADDWLANNLSGGLSSGEGLIHALRDDDDDPRTDKRLLVREGEFASVLKVLTREGNTLSAMLRQAWDGDTLRVLTKNAPEKASETHVSIIGHITQDELVRHLSATEAANGFGNRFLWFCVKRAQHLPFGGQLDSVDFAPVRAKLREAIAFVESLNDRRINFDEAASRLWAQVYPQLTQELPGLLGAMTARGEAQVVRLALIYALLDCSQVITVAHLQAALALWEYAHESAAFIFGEALGDPIVDTMLSALRVSEHGLTRTEISTLFGRNKPAAEIERALALLRRQQLAFCEREESAGRTIERWRAMGMKASGGAKKGRWEG